jgi:hypothetical protein
MSGLKSSSVNIEIPVDGISSHELSKLPVKYGLGMFGAIPLIGIELGNFKALMPIKPDDCLRFMGNEFSEIFQKDVKTPLKITLDIYDTGTGKEILKRNAFLTYRCSTALLAAMFEYHSALITYDAIHDNAEIGHQLENIRVKDWDLFWELCEVSCICESDNKERYSSKMLNPYLFDFSFFPE